jgi:hypothetical protein
MGLLHEIQEAIVQEGADLGSILLKLRFLASRLGSDYLEEWVKHEAEGYPEDSEVPEYRKVGVSYSATFSGPFGSGIRNAPIPSYLIKKHAGEHWVKIDIRESIAGVDEMVRSTADGSTLGIDASNLILLLQGKVYENYACNAVEGTISRTSLAEIQQAVRGRILELTLKLEKAIPAAAEIQFGRGQSKPANADQVQQISHQVIYGNVTTVTGGAGSQITLSIAKGDKQAFVRELANSGIPEADAAELAEIISSEEPDSADEPFGAKARAWLANNLKKAATGSWKVGVTVATKVLSEAALKYYGLK